MISRSCSPLLSLLLVGCSSAYKLDIVNETDAPLEAVVIWQDNYRDGTRHRTQNYSLSPGEEKTGSVWYRETPSTFVVRVQAGERRRERTFRGTDFTDHIRRTAWSSSNPRLIVRNGEIAFAD